MSHRIFLNKEYTKPIVNSATDLVGPSGVLTTKISLDLAYSTSTESIPTPTLLIHFNNGRLSLLFSGSTPATIPTQSFVSLTTSSSFNFLPYGLFIYSNPLLFKILKADLIFDQKKMVKLELLVFSSKKSN